MEDAPAADAPTPFYRKFTRSKSTLLSIPLLQSSKSLGSVGDLEFVASNLARDPEACSCVMAGIDLDQIVGIDSTEDKVGAASSDLHLQNMTIRMMHKLDINLLLEEAWKLDSKRSQDAQMLPQIRAKVARLIEAAYGQRDCGEVITLDGAMENRYLTIVDFEEFALDYFNVSAPVARQMFLRFDLDEKGRLTYDDLETALGPLFELHATLKQLFDNGVRASVADQVVLFASASSLDRDDVAGMKYLTKDLNICLYGNSLLTCITSMLFANMFFAIVNPSLLSVWLYVAQTLIYLVYCVVFWRYFRTDYWTSAGLWLYTVGYAAFTYHFYSAAFCVHGANGPELAPMGKAAGLLGAVLFTIGSINFIFALVRDGGDSGGSIRFEYAHCNASARGGLLFFIGSILFALDICGSTALSFGQATILSSTGYSFFVWGRIEFLMGTIYNNREADRTLEAALTWRTLTTGIEVHDPTFAESCLHLFFGKRHGGGEGPDADACPRRSSKSK